MDWLFIAKAAVVVVLAYLWGSLNFTIGFNCGVENAAHWHREMMRVLGADFTEAQVAEALAKVMAHKQQVEQLEKTWKL